jgi:hypothetical protein
MDVTVSFKRGFTSWTPPTLFRLMKLQKILAVVKNIIRSDLIFYVIPGDRLGSNKSVG